MSRNLNSIGKYKEDMSVHFKALERRVEAVYMDCTTNHAMTGKHVDDIALKFAETTVDLRASAEGFAREIERVQALFRELS